MTAELETVDGDRLREDVVREVAAAHGVPVNPVEFAASGDEAAHHAQTWDRPVAVKLVAEGVVHKRKAGGVVLNVSPQAVAGVVDGLIAEHREAGRRVHGVTVEPMVEAGLEAVIGGLDLPGYGPAVMVGAGGTDIEALGDVAWGLAPISHDEALDLVLRTGIGRVIAARHPDQVAALAAAVVAVGGPDGMVLGAGLDQVDLNPVVVTGDAVVAVDARAVRRPARESDELPDPQTSLASIGPGWFPDAVAVVGASADPAKLGSRAVRHLVDFGFAGSIYPISAKVDAVCGVPTIASIEDLPTGVDRAVVAVPAPVVPDVLERLAEREVSVAHVYTADTPAIPESVLRSRTRVLGPNCMGQYTPAARLTFIGPSTSSGDGGEITVISQSGTYASDMVRRGNNLGVSFRSVSSVGNCEDVQPSELLAAAIADPGTRVVAAYLEDDRDLGRFLRVAAGTDKAVLLLKGGRTQAGTVAAASHTGALAADPRLLDDVARGAGVLLVDTEDEMMDVLQVLQHRSEPCGGGLALVGTGGGVAVVGADLADRHGLTLPAFSAQTDEALRPFQAPGSSLRNPIDIPVWSLFGDGERYTGAIVSAVTQDRSIDALCFYIDTGTFYDVMAADEAETLVRGLVDDMLEAVAPGVLAMLALRSGYGPAEDTLVRDLRSRASALGVPTFMSAEQSIVAFGRARRLQG